LLPSFRLPRSESVNGRPSDIKLPSKLRKKHGEIFAEFSAKNLTENGQARRNPWLAVCGIFREFLEKYEISSSNPENLFKTRNAKCT
jgi:hypothetical protein